MKVNFYVLLLVCTHIHFSAQIKMADSTAQAVTYWNKGDKQKFTISNEKIKIKGTDTTSKEKASFDVDVLVLNASDKSYTIQWTYKNFKTNITNPLTKKVASMARDLKVVYKTDEVGTFTELVNWKEIRDHYQNLVGLLKKDPKITPEIQQSLFQVEKAYTTKESLEAAAIKDIQQFHTFHGGKYKLGEVLEGNLKVANIFGGEPFDATLSVSLDEINETDNNFVVRSSQSVNQEQLTKATLDYLSLLAKSTKVKAPQAEDVKDLKNETLTASRIHGTGWVIYSIMTTIVNLDNTTNIDERIIELK